MKRLGDDKDKTIPCLWFLAAQLCFFDLFLNDVNFVLFFVKWAMTIPFPA